MNVQPIDFDTFKDHMQQQGQDGIVLLGAGGDLLEWVFGVTSLLHQEGIIENDDYTEAWLAAYKLTTTGGRHDLALTFNPKTNFHMGKMALWRLKIGDCSWIMDYVVNYEDQHQA